MSSVLEMEMELSRQSSIERLSRPMLPGYTVPREDLTSGQVFESWWTNETLLGDAKSFLQERSEYSGETPDLNFNPYEYYETNKKDFGDLEPYILDGHFGKAQGPRQFQAIANSLRRELENRRIIENTEGWDYGVGMGASLLDPSTFIPIFGWAGKASVAAKAVRTAAQVGGVVAVEEGFHHMQQRARTAYESMMAVGIGTVLGGGLGGLGGYLSSASKSHFLHPDNPKNPLREDQLGPHDDVSETVLSIRKSVSEQLDEAGVDHPTFKPGEGVTLKKNRIGRALDWTQDKIGWMRTPTTVANHTSSNEARNLLTSLAEMGLRTTEMAAGKARNITVELWKDMSVYARQMAAEQDMVLAWEELRKAQGAKSAVAAKYASDAKEAAASVGVKINENALSLGEFALLVQRHMRGGKLSSSLDPDIAKAVEKASRGYNNFYREMFERAVKVGLLKADQKITSYLPQVWDQQAIINNPQALIDAFKIKFANRYADDPEGLEEFASELVDKLAKGEHPGLHKDGFVRQGSFKIGKSKRMESREIFIEPDQLDLFEEFLMKDLTLLSKRYADDMGGRIALTEFFGKYTGKNEELLKFEELANPMKRVKAEFKELRKGKSGDELTKINRDEELVSEAVDNLRQRLLNIDKHGNHGDGALFSGRMLRRVNFLRFMGSVMLASLTDLATVSFSHGALPHFKAMASGFGKLAKEAKGMNNRELAFMLYGAEGTMSHQRMAKLYGLDEASRRGFGMGKTRSISAGVDATVDYMSNQMNIFNLMHWWNSRHKFVTGHVVLGNLLDDAARLNRGEKLAARGRRSGNYRWNELGISDDMLRRIDNLTEKYGFDEQVDGLKFRWPDTDKWMDDKVFGGAEVVYALSAALKRSTDRAVITPGIADLPMFHSTQMGQLLFQFNSFGFAAANKFVRNLGDEAFHGDLPAALMAITWSLGTGTMAYAVREGMIKGKDLPDPRDEPATWMYEAIDRSGLLAWIAPYGNAGMKLMAPHLQEMGIEITQPSRFAQQNWYESLAGPSISTLKELGTLGYYTSQGDMEKIYEKGKRLTPYRNLFYLEAGWRLAWGDD